MLIKREVLEAIKAGSIDLQFRRWSRPTVKPGGTLKTGVGLLRIGRIDDMQPAEVSEADARRAGFADRAGFGFRAGVRWAVGLAGRGLLLKIPYDSGLARGF